MKKRLCSMLTQQHHCQFDDSNSGGSFLWDDGQPPHKAVRDEEATDDEEEEVGKKKKVMAKHKKVKSKPPSPHTIEGILYRLNDDEFEDEDTKVGAMEEKGQKQPLNSVLNETDEPMLLYTLHNGGSGSTPITNATTTASSIATTTTRDQPALLSWSNSNPPNPVSTPVCVRRSDPFCWSCHLWGADRRCSRCPLAWHSRCASARKCIFTDKARVLVKRLKHSESDTGGGGNGGNGRLHDQQAWVHSLASVRDDSVCVECARREAGLHYATKFGFLHDLQTDHRYMHRVTVLFEYAVGSLILQKTKRVGRTATATAAAASEPRKAAKRGGRKSQSSKPPPQHWRTTTTTAEPDVDFDEFVHIDYGQFVGVVSDPIDLQWIRRHVRLGRHTSGGYLCTEDFMFHIKMLTHNFLVLHILKAKAAAEATATDRWAVTEQQQQQPQPQQPSLAALKRRCQELEHAAQSESEFINRCDSCYRNFYEVDHDKMDDMLMPCEHGHGLAWVTNHHRWWPAKVYEYRESRFFYNSDEYVYYVPFGDDKKRKKAANWIKYKRLFKFSEQPPESSSKMLARFGRLKCKKYYQKLWDDAMRDVEDFRVTNWNRYYREPYTIPTVARPFELDDLYAENTGGLRPEAGFDENFKLTRESDEDDEENEEQEEKNENEEEEEEEVVSVDDEDEDHETMERYTVDSEMTEASGISEPTVDSRFPSSAFSWSTLSDLSELKKPTKAGNEYDDYDDGVDEAEWRQCIPDLIDSLEDD